MPALNFLIKPSSSMCNLSCKYCFYNSLSEKRNIKSYGFMEIDTLEIIIKKGLSEAEGSCTFAFQGGEPTLIGLDFYKKLIEFEKKYNVKSLKINNVLQTNATLIDEDWASFLAKNKFLVGISLDGPKDINDLHRIYSDGKGSYNKIIKAISYLDKYKVEYNVLSVVTASVARYGRKVYDFYKKNNFKYFQFIQCLDPLGEEFGGNKFSLKPEAYGKFLCDVFDKWYEDILKNDAVSIRYFDNLVSMIQGGRPEACGMSGICSCEYVIEADGGVYPCDFYVLDKWCMGNIKDKSVEELFYSQAAQDFIKVSTNVDEKCRTCKWLNICRGGCRRHREPILGEIPSLNYFCKSYEMFFEHSIERLEFLANRF
ncbi:MAG: anaerobic sulfatase maturase [Clostridiaceae bacterium]